MIGGRRTFPSLALALVAGCGPPTEALLAISAGDLNVPGDLDSVHIEVHQGGAADGTLLSSSDVKLCGLTESGDGCKRMPFTVLFVPGDHPEVPALVEVNARHGAGDVIRDAFRFTFVAGESLRFELAFYRTCEQTLCGGLGLACAVDGSCGPLGSAGKMGDLAVATPGDLAGIDLAIGPRRVFLAGPVSGLVGGYAAADKVCQTAADAVPLGGRFVAILGSHTKAPIDYLVLDGGGRKIVRTDGKQVCTDDTFWVPNHLFPIVTNAAGQPIPPTNSLGQNAWTNFTDTGALGTIGDCGEWTTGDSVSGGLGNPYEDTAPGTWAAYAATTCGISLHLYCIEQ